MILDMALDSTLSPLSVNIPLPGPSALAFRLWLGFPGRCTLPLSNACCWSTVKESKMFLYILVRLASTTAGMSIVVSGVLSIWTA